MENTNSTPANGEPTAIEAPSAPIGTILTTIGLLGTFVGLIGIMYYFANDALPVGPDKTPEQKLQELRASDQNTLGTYKFDKNSGKAAIPVERALELELQHAGTKGQLTFPLAPKAAPAPMPTPMPPTKAPEPKPMDKAPPKPMDKAPPKQ